MLIGEKGLARRRQLGNLRQLKLHLPLIDFASNDYLGLARSPQLAAAVSEEWQRHRGEWTGLGSTGSRLLTGNSEYAHHLEERIARFHVYPEGLLFSCGYMANLGLLSAIADKDSAIFFDAGVHASVREGIRLSRSQAFPFRHQDLDHLENRLQRHHHCKHRFICIESIYSTDGAVAPLPSICALAKRYDAHVIVDEAHAVGVVGPEGRGLVAQHHLTDQVFAQVVTFGKALGAYGAIVLGSSVLKKTLINFATSQIYTTALPLLNLAAIKCSYDIFPDMEAERKSLRELITIFQKSFLGSSQTHIQSIPVKTNNNVKRIAQELAISGFHMSPLMSPTVRQGEERLRLCLHAFNTGNELEQLLEMIGRIGV